MKSGEGEIRTRGRLAPTDVFKTSALDHYATSPSLRIVAKKGKFYTLRKLPTTTPTVVAMAPMMNSSIADLQGLCSTIFPLR